MSLSFIAVTASVVFPREFRNISGDPVDPVQNPAQAEMKRLTRELKAINSHMDKKFKDSKSAQEWKRIALVIDHLMFYLYIFFCVVAFTTMGVVWYESIRNSQKNILNSEWRYLRYS